MVNLVALLQSPQDGNRIFHRGFIHLHRLEPPLQRRVLFDIFAVLVQRRGPDAVQLSPGQHGLEHVAGIQRAVRFARAHDGVELVDEQDDLPLALFHVLQHGLQPFLEFPAVFGARHQRAHIQREDLLVLQSLRHVAPHDPLGQPFHHGGFAHAGLADQHRIIFRLSGQNADHVPDLRIPSDHRIQLLGPRPFHQILSVLFQGIVSRFRIVGNHPLIAPYRGKGL